MSCPRGPAATSYIEGRQQVLLVAYGGRGDSIVHFHLQPDRMVYDALIAGRKSAGLSPMARLHVPHKTMLKSRKK